MAEKSPEGERRARRRVTPLSLAALVFMLTAAMIALAGASLFHVGGVASREADAQARANDHRLLANALRDRRVLLAREQLGLARWNRSYQSISVAFDESFLRDEFADWVWSDFRHDWTFLVAPEATILMSARRDATDFKRRALAANDPVAIVARRVADRFMQTRRAVPGGFAPRRVEASKVENAAEFAYASINGEPAMISAMAIVPDDSASVAMPDGPPVVMVSAKSLRRALAADINAQLAFAEFRFSAEAATPDAFALTGLDGAPLGFFTWKSDEPGAKIWRVVVPVIVLLALALAFGGILVARFIGRMAKRLEASEARNRKLALEDSLSGLANRLAFNQALDATVASLPRPFAVIACDLDRFKAVNDTYGHAAGDLVIRTVAGRFRALVGDDGLVARTGGDEFVILLTGFTERARIEILAKAMLGRICDPIALDDGGATDVGVSLGVAIAPAGGGDARAIMASADSALYAAKERGRGVAVFAADLVADTRASHAA